MVQSLRGSPTWFVMGGAGGVTSCVCIYVPNGFGM